MQDSFCPLVSIIIPVYNGADYLADAIDSALSQTYKNIEILVVNDGSTDNGKTEQIAGNYKEQIKYYSKPNGGVASALNFAIERMEGQYFSWLSHDDKYYPEKISSQIDYLKSQKNRNIVLYSDLVYIDGFSNVLSNLILPEYEPKLFRPAFIRGGLINGCTLLVPKICFDKCGFFKTNLRTTQDYDMWFRISEKYEFHHIAKILIYSRLHENQDTLKLSDIVSDEQNDLYRNFIKSIKKRELGYFSQNNISGYYANFSKKMSEVWILKAKKEALKLAILNLPFSKIKNLDSNLELIIPLIGGRKAKMLHWIKSKLFFKKNRC